MRRAVDDGQGHAFFAGGFQDLGELTCHRCGHDGGFRLAVVGPERGGLLRVGVDQHDPVAVLARSHGGMDSKCGLAGAALLAHESDGLHDGMT